MEGGEDVSYKILDMHKMQILENMNRDQGERELSFSKREYAQIYADRHIKNSLVVVKDSLDKEIRNKLETNYGRLLYVEDHPDDKGYYGIAKNHTKDSYSVINIMKDKNNYIAQTKHNIGSKEEAFGLLSNLRDTDFKQLKQLERKPELVADREMER